MERNFDLLRKIVILTRKYHINLIRYHCDLLDEALQDKDGRFVCLKVLPKKKQYKKIKKIAKKRNIPLTTSVLKRVYLFNKKKGKK